MNLLIVPVKVGIIDLKLVASCVNLCSNLLLAVGKTGLNVTLIETKISRTGNTPHNIEHEVSEK